MMFADNRKTYLESLPYHVFLNLVLNGDLKGKDLINLCNSSPLINEKCNRSFIKETGETIPQFLFYNLLRKMNADIGLRENYRDVYKTYVDLNRGFKKLQKRILKLRNVQKSFTNFQTTWPFSIYDLLYDENDGLLRYMIDVDVNDKVKKDFDFARDLIKFIIHVKNHYIESIQYLSKYRQNIEQTINSNEMNISTYIRLIDNNRGNVNLMLTYILEDETEEFIRKYREYLRKDIEKYDHPEEGEVRNLEKALDNVNIIFPFGLNLFIKNTDPKTNDDLKNWIVLAWTSNLDYYLGDYFSNIDKEELDYLQQISDLELNTLIFLHQLVLSRKISVLKPFYLGLPTEFEI